MVVGGLGKDMHYALSIKMIYIKAQPFRYTTCKIKTKTQKNAKNQISQKNGKNNFNLYYDKCCSRFIFFYDKIFLHQLNIYIYLNLNTFQ